VSVDPGKTVTRIYAMTEDETATFRAKTADGFDSGNISVTHNCTQPGATVVDSCTDGGAVVKLANTGQSFDTFGIAKDGVVEAVTVAGGDTFSKTYPMAEDTTSVFRVATLDGYDSGPISITHNCLPPTQVLGVQLPRTGSNTGGLALRGVALLLLGLVVVRWRKVIWS